MGKVPSVILTFLIVTVGWAIFRIENLPDAFTFISRLFAFDFTSFVAIQSPQFYTTLVMALVLAFIVLLPFGKKLQNSVFYTDFSKKQHLALWPVAVFLLLFCLGALNAAGFSPFIYFRF
jgi:D-alanyl-lipoteichoic acid acyltransferase DltB (MBOAT superfamily)